MLNPAIVHRTRRPGGGEPLPQDPTSPAPLAPSPPSLLGRRLTALLALPFAGNALLLALIFGALLADHAGGQRAAAALDRAARGRDLHLAALQHRDAVRELLAGTTAARDVEAAALRLERAAQVLEAAGAGTGAEAGRALAASRRALSLAAEAAAALGPLPAVRARFDDAFGREVLPAVEDAARIESDDARSALASAHAQGRRRLWLGAVLALLSIGLAVGPTLLLARQLARAVRALRDAARRFGQGDFREPVAPQDGELGELAEAMNLMAAELELTRARDQLVTMAESRVQTLEEARAELEARVEERTRALARANADLADNLRRLAEAQQRLLVADRLAAIGQLASSVAHEVNNPISCVSANLRFLADEVRTLAGELRAGGRPIEVEREAEIASAFADARDAARRVASIVRDLRTISRGEGEALTRVDLREALEAALNVAQAGFRQHARVERRLDEVPPVTASVSRLGQVFLPLLLLAGRSIAARGPAARGTIRIATFSDPVGNAVAEVRDDGAGLSAEAAAHLFDPFGPAFATAGPGISLAVAHGLVTSLGGTVEVQSQPGAGTTVRVLFPPASATEASTPAWRADAA